MLWRTAVVLALSLLLTPPVLAGGGQPHKWWQSGEVRRELGLTDEQSTRIEAIFQEVLPTLRSQKRELDRLEDALSTLLRSDTASEADVSKQIDEVEAARAALSKSRTLMLFRMHRLLSSDQRAALRRLHERHSHDRDGERDRRRREHERF